ncbi:MAG: Chromosome partition protein Smc [Candidatus Heimdallarchaeota archaeon LC_3]|nr:MAG: Chromosome partition protein Smc [Candidatus Heimdallarchaeota archaeon LC_3]
MFCKLDLLGEVYMPICEICGSYYARKELGCPNCTYKEQEKQFLDDLEQKLKESRQSLSKVKEDYNQSVNVLKQQSLEIEKQLQHESDNINNLISDLANVEREQDKTKINITDLKTRMRDIDSEIKTLTDKKVILSSKYTEFSEQISDLNKTIEEKKLKKYQKNKNEIDEIEKILNSEKDEKRKLEAQSKKLILEKESLINQIESDNYLKNQLNLTLEQYKKASIESTESESVLKNKSEIETERGKRVESIKEHQRDLESKLQALDSSKGDFNHKQKRIDDLNQKISILEKEKQEKEKEISDAAEKLNELALSAQYLQAKIDEMNIKGFSDIDQSITMTVDETKKSYDASKKLVNEKFGKIDLHQKTVESLQKELENLELAVTSANDEKKLELNNQIPVQKQKIIDYIGLIKNLQSETLTLEAAVEISKENFDKAQAELNNAIKSSQNQTNEFQELINEATEELKHVIEGRERRKFVVEEKEAEINSIQDKIEESKLLLVQSTNEAHREKSVVVSVGEDVRVAKGSLDLVLDNLHQLDQKIKSDSANIERVQSSTSNIQEKYSQTSKQLEDANNRYSINSKKLLEVEENLNVVKSQIEAMSSNSEEAEARKEKLT